MVKGRSPFSLDIFLTWLNVKVSDAGKSTMVVCIGESSSSSFSFSGIFSIVPSLVSCWQIYIRIICDNSLP